MYLFLIPRESIRLVFEYISNLVVWNFFIFKFFFLLLFICMLLLVNIFLRRLQDICTSYVDILGSSNNTALALCQYLFLFGFAFSGTYGNSSSRFSLASNSAYFLSNNSRIAFQFYPYVSPVNEPWGYSSGKVIFSTKILLEALRKTGVSNHSHLTFSRKDMLYKSFLLLTAVRKDKI